MANQLTQNVPVEVPLGMLNLLDNMKNQIDAQVEQIKEEIVATVEIMSDKKLVKEIREAKKQIESGKGLSWEDFKAQHAS